MIVRGLQTKFRTAINFIFCIEKATEQETECEKVERMWKKKSQVVYKLSQTAFYDANVYN